MPEPNRRSRRRDAVSGATSRATRRRSGIRNDRYKLIFFYGDRLGMTGSDDCVSTPSWEFYDLRTDPHENRNQYGNPAYAEVIGAMKREMLELRRQYKDTDEGSARMREIMETHYAPESAKH